MRVHSIGQAVTIDSVQPSLCFAFRRQNVTFLAMKVRNEQSVAILWPYHPNNPNIKLGLLGIDDFKAAFFQLWLVPDLIVNVKPTLDGLRSKTEYKESIGSLVLTADQVLVTIQCTDGATACLNLHSGDVTYNNLPDCYVWFEHWSVALADIDGDHHIVCTIPDPTVAPTNFAPGFVSRRRDTPGGP
jgi:hypothetical protein